MGFLPLTKEEMLERGWDMPDFVYVSGDAYIDHPSFGMAIITRVLESHGFRICVIPQPDWRTFSSVTIFGRPRYGFLVSSGNMDSMVNHYTVSKRRRNKDSYSPGGKTGFRPDRAVTVYSNLIRQAYKDIPIIIGGIEASLRRLSHYDYWDDRVKRSILLDSGADIISYGMGERSIVEICEALRSGIGIRDISWIRGTVYKTRKEEDIYDALRLPDFETLKDPTEEGKKKYSESFKIQYQNTDPIRGRRLYECYDGKMFVVQNPPSSPLTRTELDDVYDLPYMRAAHPSYGSEGIPALGDMKLSITQARGCFGECSFCALTMHEGRIVQTRSHESILKEASLITREPDFRGYIFDVGGPTAEFRFPSCEKQLTKGSCIERRCLTPKPCGNLHIDHSDYLDLLRKIRSLPGVKKVFIRSGFRFDYLMADPDRKFLEEIAVNHVSGQMRVAPEHVSDNVLKAMGKPENKIYNAFVSEFKKINRKFGLNQYVVPYLMSSHPGSGLKEAIELAEFVRDMGCTPDQVQDFYPTPGTISTAMYYTGLDPITGKEIYVPRTASEKAMQRALIQYKRKENRALVLKALKLAGREDLIGYGEKCLIRPERPERSGRPENKKDRKIRKTGKPAGPVLSESLEDRRFGNGKSEDGLTGLKKSSEKPYRRKNEGKLSKKF